MNEIDTKINELLDEHKTMSGVIAFCVGERIKVQNSIGKYWLVSGARRDEIDEEYSKIILRICELMYGDKPR